jgi:hypothetical protein
MEHSNPTSQKARRTGRAERQTADPVACLLATDLHFVARVRVRVEMRRQFFGARIARGAHFVVGSGSAVQTEQFEALLFGQRCQPRPRHNAFERRTGALMDVRMALSMGAQRWRRRRLCDLRHRRPHRCTLRTRHTARGTEGRAVKRKGVRRRQWEGQSGACSAHLYQRR